MPRGVPAKPRWLDLAGKCLAVAAVALLCLLPASALLGNAAPFRDPAFLVAWGGEGGIPALALTGALPEAPREALVLLPGCAPAGASLRTALEEEGTETLAALFLPTGSPFPKGAKALQKNLGCRLVAVAEDSRSRTDWKSVVQRAAEQGARVERILPSGGERSWTAELYGWKLVYRKRKDGELEGVLSRQESADEYRFRNLETGEFVLERGHGASGTPEILLTLPRINRPGTLRIPLPR